MQGVGEARGTLSNCEKTGEGRTSVWKERLRPLPSPSPLSWAPLGPQLTSGDAYIPGLFVLFLGGRLLAHSVQVRILALLCTSWKTSPTYLAVLTEAGPAPLQREHLGRVRALYGPVSVTGVQGPGVLTATMSHSRFLCLTCPVKQNPFFAFQRPVSSFVENINHRNNVLRRAVASLEGDPGSAWQGSPAPGRR